jgi:hypothetical protein
MGSAASIANTFQSEIPGAGGAWGWGSGRGVMKSGRGWVQACVGRWVKREGGEREKFDIKCVYCNVDMCTHVCIHT